MDNEIEKLIQAFANDIPKRATDLQASLDALLTSLDQGGVARWDELEHHTHKMAGVSGTYGFMQLSAICFYLEELISGSTFKALARPVCAEHLRRWSTIFTEQWKLASERKKPFEQPEQLVGALGRHLTSITGAAA